ncbi:DUF4468 domain-containing protein [Flavobacterium sp. LB3P122]|uniref:DUF4468 domain-containing protein n=1 Tax=Flavobacterium algoriphilum TaxID=3398738 RepID=UPI003A865C58
MKKIFLLLVLVCSFSYGQETEFKFTKDGLTDFVVIDCPGKTQAELYKKALDWVLVTYKNPNEVLKAKIENDYIRIDGASSGLILQYILGMPMEFTGKYTTEIFFKEGKFKFDITALGYYHPGSKYGAGVEVDILNGSMSDYFRKDETIRATFKKYPEKFSSEFNGLTASLKEFVMSDKIPSKKSDW